MGRESSACLRVRDIRSRYLYTERRETQSIRRQSLRTHFDKDEMAVDDSPVGPPASITFPSTIFATSGSVDEREMTSIVRARSPA